MTITPPPPAPAPKPGRPRKDAATTTKLVRVYTNLTPAERDGLAERYGSVWAGLQHAAREVLSKPK